MPRHRSRSRARRQTHEAALHRADAEQAASRAVAFEPGFAADGIDELFNGFYAARDDPRGRLHH